MKVIIGVDGSPHSQATIAGVIAMAWPQRTEMVVVSAYQMPYAASTEAYAPVALDVSTTLADLKQMHHAMAEHGAEQLKLAGFQARAIALEGDPSTVLLDEARRVRADLLVVGSHGHTGIASLLLGNVATHVVSHSPCNVLVVRRSAWAA